MVISIRKDGTQTDIKVVKREDVPELYEMIRRINERTKV